MKRFAPLLRSYRYLFRGARMTLLMASAAVVPPTLLGMGLALPRILGPRVMRFAVMFCILVIRGNPLLLLVLRSSVTCCR